MKFRDALKEFNRLLKARGTNASWVSVGDGIDTMIEFYRISLDGKQWTPITVDAAPEEQTIDFRNPARKV